MVIFFYIIYIFWFGYSTFGVKLSYNEIQVYHILFSVKKNKYKKKNKKILKRLKHDKLIYL